MDDSSRVAALKGSSSAEVSPAAGSRWVGTVAFPVTVLFSAFLLFQVQPLLGKFILPWFGGSPAVWTTAMLFFQITLFLGYAYAHGLVKFLAPSRQAAVHAVVVVLACVVLPIIPADTWKEQTAGDPTWVIFLLLAATVGLPYFVLSATGPLLQAWFHVWKSDGSPYRLYALSNVGSLAGLLTYPFLVEPRWRLHTQATAWSNGFLAFAAVCGVTGLVTAKAAIRHAGMNVPAARLPDRGTVTFWQRLAWLLLPMLGSVLLLATTNHVCQDVAVVPFLWVIPLSLYLVTFIICFDRPGWYVRRWVAPITVVWLLVMEAQSALEEALNEFMTKYLQKSFSLGFEGELILYFGAMFLGCMVCHGELVRLKPEPARLTEFYLMMSAGGALGGLFVGLVAPVIFDRFWEWSIAIVVTCVLSLWVAFNAFKPEDDEESTLGLWLRLLSVSVAGGFALVAIVKEELDRAPVVFIDRNFYGVVTVREFGGNTDTDRTYALVNGSTRHGRQFLDPESQALPLSYYGENSGAGQVLNRLRNSPLAKVGAVGLGVGTVATYAEPGHEYRFYEINPVVEGIARKYFTYLEKCRGRCDVVMGDARLSLEREPPQNFNVLILDAFSSDAIPAHLLTNEAFQVYLKHLSPRGLIVVHISNRYLDLEPVVKAIAKANGLSTVTIDAPKEGNVVYGTTYVVLSRDPEQLQSFSHVKTTPGEEPGPEHLWTDDFSDLMSVLNR